MQTICAVLAGTLIISNYCKTLSADSTLCVTRNENKLNNTWKMTRLICSCHMSHMSRSIFILSYFNHQTNQGSPRTSKGSLGCSSWALRCLLCWACRSLWPWWPLGGSAVGVVGVGAPRPSCIAAKTNRWGGPLPDPCERHLGSDENAEFERNTENTRSQTKCSTLPFSQTSHSKQRVDRSHQDEL